MAEGNAGVFDYEGIKSILDAKGYEPIYPCPPRCPRWGGKSCPTPCENYRDCYLKQHPVMEGKDDFC